MRTLKVIAILLFGLACWTRGADRGFAEGYGTAMADVYLGITTAEKYINGLNKPVRKNEGR